jgi:hypothetical protein
MHMPRPKKLTPEIKQGLENAERVVNELKAKSQQPRFDKKTDDYFVGTMRWMKQAFETIPEYSNDSRFRSKWLNQFWPNEPYLAGLINSVVQIDRNRGWSLVGGRNQVLRFTDILHNWQVQPGRASWREGVGTMAQAFYTQDIGGLAEVGRQFKSGPMSGIFHLDPTRCQLTANYTYPLKYYPPRATMDGKRMVEMLPVDYMRVASAINIDETFNGLGYSALSRAVELAITMVAVWRHEQEVLFARAPKGLLMLKGIRQETWDNAMKVRDATLDGREQQWFGAVAVLATAGMDDVDAKLLALSQLPENFDQEKFTNLMIYGYSLCFGFDPREFWPVSSGSLGTATETETQHRKATDKGGAEFHLGLQEELQGNLPDTLHFEFDERSVEGDLAEAELQAAQIAVVNAMGGDLSQEQRLTLLAEQGIIPREWTVVEETVEATDVEDADSPENDDADVPGTEETDEEGTPETPIDENAQMLELPEVRRALAMYPNEKIVRYTYHNGRGRMRDITPLRKRTYFITRAKTEDAILAGMALEVEAIKNRQQPATTPGSVTVNLTAQMPAPGEPTITLSPVIQPSDVIIQQTQPAAVTFAPVIQPSAPTPITIENKVNLPAQANTINLPALKPTINVAPAPVTVRDAPKKTKRVKIIRDADDRPVAMEEE